MGNHPSLTFSFVNCQTSFWLTHREPGGSKNIAFRNTVSLVSGDCCTKSPQTGWLKRAEFSSLTVLEARDPWPRCWQAGSFWNLQGELVLASPLASGSSWPPLVLCGPQCHHCNLCPRGLVGLLFHLSLPCVCVSRHPSLFFCSLEPSLCQYDLVFTWLKRQTPFK